MDLTGSLGDALIPVFDTAYGSYDEKGGELVGSSAIDTLLNLPRIVTNLLLNLGAAMGADAGSKRINV